MANLRDLLQCVHPGATVSTIFHVGPPAGRQGGPAGYLAQLQAAFDLYGHGSHEVRLPQSAPPSRAVAPPSERARLMSIAGRVRRMFRGAPQYYRPSRRDLLTVDGPLAVALGEAWSGAQGTSATALADALATGADVIFAHDVASAEAALAERGAGQQVWVFLHSPMPYALYVAWCWGVPEQSWEEVAAYRDVQTWTAREIRALEQVDRIVLPSADAADELIRVDSGYRAPLQRARFLLTGGAGPRRKHPAASARDLRRRWNLPEDERLGLFLGNAQPYRGLDVVTDAVAALPALKELPGAIAVAGVDRERLARHPRLHGLGRVQDVADLLAAVDFVINVNRFSLLDLSLIEAAEAGRPLLLHDAGGNRTFARLGAGAVTIGDLSPTAVGEGLRQMFTLDASTLASLGARSRSCYDTHFTLRHLRDRHVALYDESTVTANA